MLATTTSPEGAASDTGAALATNLQIKGLATWRRISCGFLVKIDERVAELCSKLVREHCIEFLENRRLVLMCVAMRGLDEKWHVLGLYNVKSVFEGSTSVLVH